MRRIVIAAVGAAILGALILGAPAGAAADGPDIALGTPAGNKLPVNAVTVATAPYNGFNLHVSATVSAGVVLTNIVGSPGGTATAPNSVLLADSDGDGVPDAGSVFCAPQTSEAPNEKVFGCLTLPVLGNPEVNTTASGLLATFIFNATGNGCIQARLVDVPADSANADRDGTYTATGGMGDLRRQTNHVSTAPVNILIGAGAVAECGGHALPSVGSGASPNATEWTWLAISVLAIGAVVIGVGVGRRRPVS